MSEHGSFSNEPSGWDGIRFRIRWRGRPVRVAVDHTQAELLLDGRAVRLIAGGSVRVARSPSDRNAAAVVPRFAAVETV